MLNIFIIFKPPYYLIKLSIFELFPKIIKSQTAGSTVKEQNLSN